MDTVDGLLILAHQARRHGFVGEQHVFLDQLMRDVVLDLLDAQDAALFVEADFGFGKIQRERTVLKAQPADPLREFMRVVQHLNDGSWHWSADLLIGQFRFRFRSEPIGRSALLQNREHFLVGEAALRMDNRRIKLGAQHAAIVGEEKLDALRQAIHVGLERAEFVAQGFRQHRDDAVNEIGGVAAFARLDIQRRAGLHVVRHVSDVNPELPLIARNSLETNRIIEILRVVGVNRDDLMRATIFAPGDFVRRDG